MASGEKDTDNNQYLLLGPVAALVRGVEASLGGPRQVAVLTRLLLTPRRLVSMDALAECVWGTEIPARPDVAIRSYVSNLRKIIEPHRKRRATSSCLTSIGQGYRLDVGDDDIDWIRFERLLNSGREAARYGETYAALTQLSEALSLWKGEPCAGLGHSHTLTAFRSRLAEQHVSASELLIDVRVQLGDHRAVIGELESLIVTHPLRERLTELLMVSLYRSGRQSQALEAARRLRGQLIDQLGVDPGQSVSDLEVKILNHDPSLALASDVTAQKLVPPSIEIPAGEFEGRGLTGESPQRGPSTISTKTNGVESLLEADSSAVPITPFKAPSLFLGRSAEMSEMAAKFEAARQGQLTIQMVTGPSGMGKTSLAESFLAGVQDQAIGTRGACIENDSTWLWVWTEALGRLLDWLPEQSKVELVADHPALTAALPQLARFNPRSQGESLAPKAHTYGGIEALLRLCARRRPLVIVLDNLHLADGDSLDLLSYLADRAMNLKALVIGCYSLEGASDSNTAKQLDDLSFGVGVELELAGLTAGDVLEYLETVHPTLANVNVDIVNYCGGNPAHMLIVIKALGDSGKTRLAGLEIPRQLRTMVHRRLFAMAPTLTNGLVECARQKVNLDPNTLTELVSLSPEDALAALEQGLSEGILVRDGASIRFVSPLIARIVSEAPPMATSTAIPILPLGAD